MRVPRFLSSAALMLVSFATAHAASFDCSKAVRPVEKIICSDPKLSAAESAMAAAYREDLARLPESGIENLRLDQLKWIDWLQTVCDADAVDQPRTTVARCMQKPYADRTHLLRSAISIREDVLILTRTEYLALSSETDANVPFVQYSGFDTLVAAWPEAQTADPDWVMWNHAMLAATQSIAKQAAGASGSAAEWQPEDAKDNDAEVTTRILDVGDGRITTQSGVVRWRGAHPSEVYGNTTWLLAAHRALRASDIFREGTPWVQVLSSYCWEQLQKTTGKSLLYPEVNGPEAPKLLQVVQSELNWHAESDGLRIDYPEYTVAPRMAHPDDAVVPWSVLKPYLVPDFTLPQKGR